MGKLIKVIGIGVGLLLLLFVVAAGVALVVIDPNDFRDDIETLAEQHIDRELSLSGDISLSLFPWIGVQMGSASLSNPKGFPSEMFVQMDSIDVKLSLVSLFSGAIVVDTVRLNGLTANLEVSEQGVNNWSSLMKASPEQPPQSEPKPKPTAGKGEPTDLPEFTVQGIEIVDAELSWRDAQLGSHYQISNFQLITGAVALGQPLQLGIDFEVSSNQPQLNGTVGLKATVNAELDSERFELDLSKLAIALNGETLPNGALVLTLSSRISGTQKEVSIVDLNVALDDIRLTGSANAKLSAPPQITFSAAIDALDLDKYLPAPVAEETSTAEPPVAAAPLDLQSMLSPLDTLNLVGDLTVGVLKVKNVTSTDIDIGVEAKKGKLTVSPMDLTLYTGTLAGTVVVDNRGAVPKIQVEQALKGVAIGPLLQDLADTDKITGAANASVSVNTRGNNVEQLTRGLNGAVDFDVRDGVIKDINVDRAICLARKGLKQLQQKSIEACPENPNTDFAMLAGKAVITNGVVNNEHISVEQVRKGDSARLAIKGYGTADLNTQRLDYHVRAAKLEASPQDPAKFVVKGNEVPVRIQGTFADFKVRPELSDAMKEKLDTKKQESKDKLTDKLDEELDVDPGDSESDKKKKALLKRLFD